MANKNARILWAVSTKDTAFDPNHVSIDQDQGLFTLNACPRDPQRRPPARH